MTTTPIADMVGRMIDAGMPRDMIVLAVETAERCLSIPRNSAENSTETADDRRRRKDRDRKREAKLYAEIPQNSMESAEIPKSTIYLEEEEDLKKERNSHDKEIPRNSRGTKIPPDWKPSPSHFAEGERLGFDRSKVEGFAHDMRLWAEANGNRAVARKADWDKTFLGWLRRQKPGAAPPPSTSSLPEERPGRPHGMPISAWNKFGQHWTPETPGNLRPDQWETWKREHANGQAGSPEKPSMDGRGNRMGQAERQLL